MHKLKAQSKANDASRLARVGHKPSMTKNNFRKAYAFGGGVLGEPDEDLGIDGDMSGPRLDRPSRAKPSTTVNVIVAPSAPKEAGPPPPLGPPPMAMAPPPRPPMPLPPPPVGGPPMPPPGAGMMPPRKMGGRVGYKSGGVVKCASGGKVNQSQSGTVGKGSLREQAEKTRSEGSDDIVSGGLSGAIGLGVRAMNKIAPALGPKGKIFNKAIELGNYAFGAARGAEGVYNKGKAKGLEDAADQAEGRKDGGKVKGKSGAQSGEHLESPTMKGERSAQKLGALGLGTIGAASGVVGGPPAATSMMVPAAALGINANSDNIRDVYADKLRMKAQGRKDGGKVNFASIRSKAMGGKLKPHKAPK